MQRKLFFLIAGLSAFLLLLLGLVLAAKSWESSLRADEKAKVTGQLDAAWSRKLRSAELDARELLQSVQEEYNDAATTIIAERDAALSELRKRPARATIKAEPADRTAPAQACTGVQLAREDAEFLAGEAAAAALQLEQLKKAERAYEACRLTLRNVTSGASTKGDSDERNRDRGKPPD